MIRDADKALDGADIVRAWNETTKVAGFCVSGKRKWTAKDLDDVLAYGDILVHENSKGEVDAALATRWKGHEEPFWDTAVIRPDRMEVTPAKVFAELGLEALKRMKAKGFTHLRMEASPVLFPTLPFLSEIGGVVEGTPMNLETNQPTEYHYRYHIDTAIAALTAVVTPG